ncbi:MAG: hypothetical protein H6577_20400 [Lewinellaceae bacterium]|nr:hypothetical protein [Saprospiraceae bacterium]MCB9340492.1 hypothetical protein [Lewinellaceae bacterium]
MKNKIKQTPDTLLKGEGEMKKVKQTGIPQVKEPKEPSKNDGGYIWMI